MCSYVALFDMLVFSLENGQEHLTTALNVITEICLVINVVAALSNLSFPFCKMKTYLSLVDIS